MLSVFLPSLSSSAILILSFLPLICAQSESSPIVNLGYATYQGTFNATSNTTNFLGIRYAAPPIGESSLLLLSGFNRNLRFQAPAPPVNTSGIQPANTQPPACPIASQGSNSTTPFRGLSKRQTPAAPIEDCLFLNVFVSGPIDLRAKMPVVLWIHGGGYVGGSSSGTSGDDLIKEAGGGIVAVSLEYRLGIFGFLAGKDVKQKGALNAGLLDQQFALKWIQQNIHLFGGDPRRVTIWGESAGAGSVMQHLIAHKGNTQPPLFHAAMTSSTFLPSQYNYDDPVPEQLYSQLAQMVSCADAEDTFACLVDTDADALQTANVAINNEGFFGTFVMVPVVDGDFIVERPMQTISRGKLNGDVLLSATNTFEGRVFVSESIVANQTVTEYISQLMPQFTEHEIERAAQVYAGTGSSSDDVIDKAIAIMGESIFICPTYFILGAFPGRSYKAEFAIPPGNHGDDIQYYFPGTSTPAYNNTQFRASFAGAFMSVVRSTDPNVHPPVPGVITPRWSPFSNGGTQMLFNMTESGQPDIRPISTDPALLQRCEFWKSVAASVLGLRTVP